MLLLSDPVANGLQGQAWNGRSASCGAPGPAHLRSIGALGSPAVGGTDPNHFPHRQTSTAYVGMYIICNSQILKGLDWLPLEALVSLHCKLVLYVRGDHTCGHQSRSAAILLGPDKPRALVQTRWMGQLHSVILGVWRLFLVACKSVLGPGMLSVESCRTDEPTLPVLYAFKLQHYLNTYLHMLSKLQDDVS